AIGNAAARLVEHRPLILHRPAAVEAPLVEAERRRQGIGVRGVMHGAAGRREMLGALVADIGLRRTDVFCIRRGLGAGGFYFYDVVGDARASRFRQELLDDAFGLGILALADMVMANVAGGIEEVVRGPVLVGE